MGLFESFHAKVLRKCRELSAELNRLPYNLSLLKSSQPKKYHEIGIKLRDIVEDIGETLREITLPDDVIDELVKYRNRYAALFKRFYQQ